MKWRLKGKVVMDTTNPISDQPPEGGVIRFFAARAIEPLCQLWCIPGFLENRWTHAFRLLRL